MLLRPQYRTIAPAALYGGGGAILQEDYTAAGTMTWVTHARTGHAMMFDSTGKLTYAPSNVILHGADAGNAAWVKSTMSTSNGVSDPDGGTNAFTITASGAAAYIYQENAQSGASNFKWIYSVWIKRRTGFGDVKIYPPDGIGAQTVAVDGTWKQFYASGVGSVSGGGKVYAFVELATSGDAVDVYMPVISRITYETTPRSADQLLRTSSEYYGPRHDYSPATLARRGLLREMAATNLLVRANPSTGWLTSATSNTTDSTLSVDGITSARKITATSTATSEFIFWYNALATVSSGATHTATMFLKAGNVNYAFLTISSWNSGTKYGSASFNLTGTSNITADQTFTAGGATVDSATAEYVGDGWFKAKVTVAGITDTQIYVNAGLSSAAATAVNFGYNRSAQTNGNYIYASFAQLETGSVSTSTIITEGTSLTRNADTLTAALYTGDSVTEYYRKVSDLSQTSRTVNPFSGVSSETDSIWVEKFTKP